MFNQYRFENFPFVSMLRQSFRCSFLFLTILVALTVIGLDANAQTKTSRLRVSSDGRFLERQDGVPFFWMGDTAWHLAKVSEADIELYLTDAEQKKFNGVLVDVSYYYFEQIGEPPFLNGNPDTPNPNYWPKVDWLVSRAEAHGIYTALVVMWGADYNLAFGDDLAKAYRFGKWLGQRYGSRNNVLWVVSGEYGEIGAGRYSIFDNMANGIRDGGGSQPMSIHPNLGSSSKDFHTSPWLDFNLLQSGYARDAADRGVENYQFIEHDYPLVPAKPVMDGEPAYEYMIENWGDARDPNGPRVGGDIVRRKAYWAVFAGAFGHTYGNFSIENLYLGFTNPSYPIPYSLPYWKDALNATGRTQMQFLRSLLESKPILGRIPDQGLLASNPGTGLDHVQATRASNGSYAWIYVPTGGAVAINMGRLAGPAVKASWYSPRDGSYTTIGQANASGTQTFDAPGAIASGNDWVLVLESTAAITATDTTPPTITGLFASDIGTSSATINWTTNEAANGQVEFLSPCPATGCLGPLSSSLTTSHGIPVANLQPATAYTYRVRSSDASGNLAVSTTDTFTTSAPTPPSPTIPSPVTQGPVGYWKFDEGAGGTAADSSGNGLTGTLANGPSWVTGASGSALSFDGVNDYVDLGNPVPLRLTGAMTLSAWVYPTGIINSGRIIAKTGGPGVRGWSLNVENFNAFEFSVPDSAIDTSNFVDSVTPVPLNKWVHVVGVYEPGIAMRLYIDGALNNSRLTNVPTRVFDPPVNARIGARGDGLYFQGSMDEVRVYNRALTAAEVQQLFSATNPTAPPAAPSDITPPVISGVSVSNLTSSSVTINWSTDEPSSGQVEFIGACPAGRCLTANIGPTLTTAHTVDVAGLSAATTYTYRLKSSDAAGNVGTTPTQTFVTPADPAPTAAPTPAPVPARTISLWNDSANPQIPIEYDAQPVEVGFKFRSDASGSITGIRFYKGPFNNGPHTISLWSETGVLLARGVSSNESAAGWQLAAFDAPVNINADTTYVASYHSTSGFYSATLEFFRSSYDNAPLHALASSASGGNGVFSYGDTPTFPTDSFRSANYWVDVVFTPAVSSGYSLWTAGEIPDKQREYDAAPVEVGVKFKSDVNGDITAIRFFKDAANTGKHTVSLYTVDGQLLARAVSTGEGGNGWQQVRFTSPVHILANTTYVASYHTTSGHYSVSSPYFMAQYDLSSTLGS